jgi:hypothetical protein
MEGNKCKDSSVIHVIDMRNTLFITAIFAERTLVENNLHEWLKFHKLCKQDNRKLFGVWGADNSENM